MRDYNAEAVRVHVANKKWWTDLVTGHYPMDRNHFQMGMLAISELAEGMEACRKDLMDDKLTHRKGIEVELADFLIRNLDVLGFYKYDINETKEALVEARLQWITPETDRGEVLFKMSSLICGALMAYDNRDLPGYLYNLAVAIDATEYVAEAWGLDVWAAYEEKMAYNAIREDHQLSSRMAHGGKKW